MKTNTKIKLAFYRFWFVVIPAAIAIAYFGYLFGQWLHERIH